MGSGSFCKWVKGGSFWKLEAVFLEMAEEKPFGGNLMKCFNLLCDPTFMEV